jgi:hypothetical protein
VNVSNQIDPVRIGEELIYRVFHDVFHNEGARQEFGFSQINSFSDEEGMPGWNLWFSQDDGAHQILLTEADVLDHVETSRSGLQVMGRFAIRYFPDKNDFLLADYSAEEIRLRRGPHFDHTGTPTVGGRQAMGEHLFLAGFLDYRTDISRQYLELSCTAPTRWKEVCHKSPELFRRNAPGWRPAMRLFDKLVTGFCHVYETMPEKVVLADKKWLRFDIEGDNEPEPRPDPEVDLLRMVVGLKLRTDTCPLVDGLAFSDLRQRLERDGFEHIQSIKPNSGHECDNWWEVKDRVFCHCHAHGPELCRCYMDH